MAEGVTVEGAAELERSLQQLADDLDDMTPAHDTAGQLLQDLADLRAPRRTGQLVSSARTDAGPTETTVSYDEVYAGVIHNGWTARNIPAQPWLADTAAESTDALTEVYAVHVIDAVGQVQGA